MNKKEQQLFRHIGPGLITAALVFGPGSLTIMIKLGAGFGYQLLWAIVVAVFFMIVYTGMSTRIGLANKDSLLEVVRSKYGKAAAIILGICIFIITAAFQTGNSIGAGVAFSGLTGISSTPWIIFFSLAAIALLFFRSFYKILERIMIVMVLLMLACFLLTLVLSRPDISALIAGLIPTVPNGSKGLTIALFASSFSIAAAFYQAYLVREKHWKADDLGRAKTESRSGIITLGLLSSMIMICAAAVLHRQQISVNTPAELALALEPLFGRFATLAFMTGFFAASFSSLVGNATIGGALLADAFGLGQQLHLWPVRRLIMLVIVLGAGIAVYFGTFPLQLIIFAQAFTIIVAPLVAIVILLLANDTGRMGALANTTMQNILAGAGLLLLLFLAGNHILTMITT
ncbi:MAG: Nramp family divalent metal transporter [Saprospiraceae bacterium]|nr:Nramp family divalent metal transporter [Lewinella sp.]